MPSQSALTTKNYDASGGRSAVLELSGQGMVRIENQREAFALCWETDFDLDDFMEKLREIIPSVTRSEPRLTRNCRGVRAASFATEDVVVFWHAESHWDRERHSIDMGVREGTVDLETVRRLIEETATSELREHEEQVVAETRELVGSRMK